MNRQRLEQLARVWRQRIVARDLLYALASALMADASARWVLEPWRWQVPLLAFLGALLVRFGASRPWSLDTAKIARHLDRTRPELEESAALCLRPPESLTLLERLQLNRISHQASESLTTQKLRDPSPGEPARNFLHPAWGWLAIGAALAIMTAIRSARHPDTPVSAPTIARPSVTSLATPLPTVLTNVFTITPPRYTGHAARRVEGNTAEAEEGANVVWDVEVNGSIRDACLVAGSIKILLNAKTGHRFTGTVVVAESTLFTLSGTLADGSAWNPPELFSIKVVKDQPPTVRIVQPAQTRTEIVPPDASVAVEVNVTDDYAVADAHLVATVAKGSGESVKFREQAVPFDDFAQGEAPTARRFTKTLDLAALGLEPGDELYFFVEVHDNRQPVANRTRSETRFLRLRGPEERPTTTGRGIAGVNLVPQYFRSERQLIIDTEKLVAERATLSDATFRERGNDLGADQALLRLRYGRFLGEDQEESPLTDHLETPLDPLQAAPPAAAPGPHAAASIAQRFRQEHVEQDREGGGEETAPRTPGNGAPLTAEQVRQPFVDSHDQHDKNTFFDSETKGTMRDALAAMWEAESYLRTARPEQALAPEGRALEILKALQQSARAYVQHVGFEAPPLKVMERRLKGDVENVPARGTVINPVAVNDPSAAIRAALAGLARSGTLSGEAMEAVQGPLAAAAAKQPEEFLAGAQTLRKLPAGGKVSVEDLAVVQRALLRLLPPANMLPARREEPVPGLAVRYYQALPKPEGKP